MLLAGMVIVVFCAQVLLGVYFFGKQEILNQISKNKGMVPSYELLLESPVNRSVIDNAIVNKSSKLLVTLGLKNEYRCSFHWRKPHLDDAWVPSNLKRQLSMIWLDFDNQDIRFDFVARESDKSNETIKISSIRDDYIKLKTPLPNNTRGDIIIGGKTVGPFIYLADVNELIIDEDTLEEVDDIGDGSEYEAIHAVLHDALKRRLPFKQDFQFEEVEHQESRLDGIKKELEQYSKLHPLFFGPVIEDDATSSVMSKHLFNQLFPNSYNYAEIKQACLKSDKTHHFESEVIQHYYLKAGKSQYNNQIILSGHDKYRPDKGLYNLIMLKGNQGDIKDFLNNFRNNYSGAFSELDERNNFSSLTERKANELFYITQIAIYLLLFAIFLSLAIRYLSLLNLQDFILSYYGKNPIYVYSVVFILVYILASILFMIGMYFFLREYNDIMSSFMSSVINVQKDHFLTPMVTIFFIWVISFLFARLKIRTKIAHSV
jgi:hypothetical protein